MLNLISWIGFVQEEGNKKPAAKKGGSHASSGWEESNDAKSSGVQMLLPPWSFLSKRIRLRHISSTKASSFLLRILGSSFGILEDLSLVNLALSQLLSDTIYPVLVDREIHVCLDSICALIYTVNCKITFFRACKFCLHSVLLSRWRSKSFDTYASEASYVWK